MSIFCNWLSKLFELTIKIKSYILKNLFRRQKNYKLSFELNKIQTIDEGKYTCVAENEIEKTSIQYDVHVLGMVISYKIIYLL